MQILNGVEQQLYHIWFVFKEKFMRRNFTITGLNSYRNDGDTRTYVYVLEGENGESFSVSSTRKEEQKEFTFGDNVLVTITKEKVEQQ